MFYYDNYLRNFNNCMTQYAEWKRKSKFKKKNVMSLTLTTPRWPPRQINGQQMKTQVEMEENREWKTSAESETSRKHAWVTDNKSSSETRR